MTQSKVCEQAIASALPSGMATPVEASQATSLGSYLQVDDVHGSNGNGPAPDFSSSTDQPENLFGSEAPRMGTQVPSFSNRPPSHLGPSRGPPDAQPPHRLPESATSQPVFG